MDTSAFNHEKVLSAARSAFANGKTRPIQFRKDQLKAMHNMIVENEQRFVQALEKDLKKPVAEAMLTEIVLVKGEIEMTLRDVEQWSKRRPVPKTTNTLFETMYLYPEPFGVVLVMGAWNYPFQLSLLPVVGAIAAGNCVILKPSEVSPATADLFQELVPRYMDKECFHVICGGIPETTELLKQRFDYIFYTGSTMVGEIIAKAASKHLTPYTLELGGKSPAYIDDTCDMEVAIRRLLYGKCLNSGQTCIAPDYLLCTKKTQEKFVETAKRVLKEWYGDDPKESNSFGRMVNERHCSRVQALITSSGKVEVGGTVNVESKFIEPTILVDVKPDDPVMKEEIFGPVLPIINISDSEEAIQFINNREKPLTLYVFSKDQNTINSFVSKTSSGSLSANDTILFAAIEQLPFGGVGYSGTGRYHGEFSFETFSHMKAVMERGYNGLLEKLLSVRYPPNTEAKMKRMLSLTKKKAPLDFSFIKYLFTFISGVAVGVLIFSFL